MNNNKMNNPPVMNSNTERVLARAKEEGLSKAMLYYSSYIKKAPLRRNYIPNKGNTYTPVGWMTEKNQNFNKELMVWKNEKLFPFFLKHGYDKKEIAEAWKNSYWRKK